MSNLPFPGPVRVLLLGPACLLLATCTLSTEPRESAVESLATTPQVLTLVARDSLHLRCGDSVPRDSAHHWVHPQSLLHLEPSGRAELTVRVEDRPPAAGGAYRCGDQGGHSVGLARPGSFHVRGDGVLDFRWLTVGSPDTSGAWTTSDEIWLSSGIPVSGRELSATLRVQGREIPVVLGFPLEVDP